MDFKILWFILQRVFSSEVLLALMLFAIVCLGKENIQRQRNIAKQNSRSVPKGFSDSAKTESNCVKAKPQREEIQSDATGESSKKKHVIPVNRNAKGGFKNYTTAFQNDSDIPAAFQFSTSAVKRYYSDAIDLWRSPHLNRIDAAVDIDNELQLFDSNQLRSMENGWLSDHMMNSFLKLLVQNSKHKAVFVVIPAFFATRWFCSGIFEENEIQAARSLLSSKIIKDWFIAVVHVSGTIEKNSD